MGKLIDAQLYAVQLQQIIDEQRERYANDEIMTGVIDLLEIAKKMALNQPAVPALVLHPKEVRSLINYTMFYMNHLAEREGIIPKYEYEPRKQLWAKLQQFERQLNGGLSYESEKS